MVKKKLTLTAILLLSVVLFAVSCSNDKSSQAPSGDRVVISAADSGILSDGLIPEANLPQNSEILDWYEQAAARELLPYALLYAKDATDGKWHCWLYIGTWQEGDKLTLGSLDTNTFCVAMDYTSEADDPSVGATGAFHFSFTCEGEPSFEFSVNGDTDGLVTTVCDVSVAP